MTDKEMCAVFSKNLTNIMHDRGIKQADIVRTLHVAKATVSGWCSGQNIPRTDALSKLIQMLDVNLSDLLTEKKPTPVSKDGLNKSAKAVLDACSDFTIDEWREMLHFAEYLVSKRTQEKET